MSTAADSIQEARTARDRQARIPFGSPLTVLDLLTLLARNWRLSARAAAAGIVLGPALAFLLPVQYTAVTTILPSGASSSLASAFASQAGELGLLAGMAGSSLGFHNPGDICVLMLRSRSVEDAVIGRFGLMQEYRKKRMSDARTALERRTSVTLNLKTGIVAIAARDGDAARAAALANGYVDEFRKFTASLAVTEAGQRRLFFSQQLAEARTQLDEADDELKSTEQKTGMLDPAGTAKASLESAVAVREQLASLQVQLRTMRTYSTELNPAVVRVKQQIEGLEGQLAQLSGAGRDAPDDPLVPKARIPEAGTEYLRSLRDVRYNEAVVAVLAKQLEIARLDEAREGTLVQIVDPAVAPDKRSSPKRLVILLASTVFAVCCSSLWIVYTRNGERRRGLGSAVAGLIVVFHLLIPPTAGYAQTLQSSAQQQGCAADRQEGADDRDCGAGDERASGASAHAQGQDGVRIRADSREQGPPDSGMDRGAGLGLHADRDAKAHPPQPRSEFEQMVADSAGRPLAVFGAALFERPPETFASVADVQVPSDYVVGPGDELLVRMWGQIDADLRVEVDRSGRIFIPRVGEVAAAGVRYGELEQYLRAAVERVFKNFDLTVAVGRLHTIQVFVMGQAKAPGIYTVSSLSTLVNAVFASGGPSAQGSLRGIELRRGSQVVRKFDLYDLLVFGDKSHDGNLQPGDVIFIPPCGPQVGMTGSVKMPAIYEIEEGTTLGAAIETAGGLSSVADASSATIERIEGRQARRVLEFPLDAKGLSFALQGGDVVHISSIVPRFDDTVTLRGYVANPGRYPFTPGMHVRDLLPGARALVPREFWLNRAGATDARQTEYPIRAQVPAGSPSKNAGGEKSTDGVEAQQGLPQQGQSRVSLARPAEAGGTRTETISEHYMEIAHSEAAGDPDAEDAPRDAGGGGRSAESLPRDLLKLIPSINWGYAVVQRVNPDTLQARLIPFDLGKALLDGDPASNLALEPGDIVTVFSQREIVAPEQARTRYVQVEGEVEHPGVYQLVPNETLREVLSSAGGLTAKAYPFGARMTRESARAEQQSGLDEMVRTAEAELRTSKVSAAVSQDAGAIAAGEAAQQSLLTSLRSLRASGRVVLAMAPESSAVEDFPAIPMEDGDKITIPPRAGTVTVSGAVYNPASFAFEPRRRVGDYLQLAGMGALNSNPGRSFVVRADGSVISRHETGGMLHENFARLPVYPGDRIVVPEKVDNGVVRALKDWGQIVSPLALTTLAIASVVK